MPKEKYKQRTFLLLASLLVARLFMEVSLSLVEAVDLELKQLVIVMQNI